MTAAELLQAFGMSRHELRTYEGGEGCSCGKEWGHGHQHTPQDRAPDCEFCDAELIPLTTEQHDRIDR